MERTELRFILFFVALPLVVLGYPQAENTSFFIRGRGRADVKVPVPPKADRRLVELEAHGDVREDYYYWLRDDERKDPDVIAYLEAENEYADRVLGIKPAEELLLDEMVSRVVEVEFSAPARRGSYFYYRKRLQGQLNKIYMRRKVPKGMGPPSIHDKMDESVPVEVLHDGVEEASKHPFFKLKGLVVSDDEKWVAYGEDTSGQERYTLHVKDIASGKDVIEPIPNTSGSYEFSPDTKSLFYISVAKIMKPDEVWRHDFGLAEGSRDTLIYNEKDAGTWIGLERTGDRKYIFILTDNIKTKGVLYLDPVDKSSKLQHILKPKKGVRYTAVHKDGYFYMDIFDEKRSNGEIVIAPVSDPTQQTVLIAHDPEVTLKAHQVKKDFLVVATRQDGIPRAFVHKLPGAGSDPSDIGPPQEISIKYEAYTLVVDTKGDFESDIIRIDVSSMTAPRTTIDFNMRTGKRAIKRVRPIKGGYDPANYKTERLKAIGHDGVQIPISVVYRPDMVKLDGSSPLVLDVYGAYQVSMDPIFLHHRLSLLDRGFIYALGHVRGGGCLGRGWSEDGKLMHKRNTIMDVVSCAQHLIQERYTSTPKINLIGGSAGGIAAGGAMNMMPELFNAVILHVPFLDVLTTLMDPTIPATVTEWNELGDPKDDPAVYWYMKSYSPVDNIREARYPHLMVTAGLFDPRVQYWEPAKFVAKLRSMKKGDNILTLRTNMDGGHLSMTGKFGYLQEEATRYAFILKMNGVDVQSLTSVGPLVVES